MKLPVAPVSALAKAMHDGVDGLALAGGVVGEMLRTQSFLNEQSLLEIIG
jgi:hypothetical protein